MAVNVTLVDKDGNEWVAGTAVEVVDLLAQGYRFKGQGTAGVADQAAPAGPKPTNPPSNVANPAPVSNTGAVSPAGDGSSK